MIGIAIALVVVGLAAMVAMVYSQSNTVRRIEETQLRQIGADTSAQKMIDQRIDNIITAHNATVEHYDSEIDQICKAMDKICEDIHRIDNDEKELRRYYVNFRTPAHPNGGYTGGFVCKDDMEEEHDQNDA